MLAQIRPIQPVLAARAIAALVRDPQDTPQVFTVINALRGRATLRRMERFRATDTGRRLLAAPRSLLDHLGDREALAALPPGTLGRTYHEFLAEEDLSAQGLATVSINAGDKRMGPDELRYFHRMRDMHDLLHVLTGYGRSPLGEICVLAFTYAQQGGRGVALIAAVGAMKVSRERPRTGVASAVWEAYRRGRAAASTEAAEWEALFAEPVSALRERFRIPPAPRYQRTMSLIRRV